MPFRRSGQDRLIVQPTTQRRRLRLSRRYRPTALTSHNRSHDKLRHFTPAVAEEFIDSVPRTHPPAANTLTKQKRPSQSR